LWRIGGVDAVTSAYEYESKSLLLDNTLTFDGRLKWWVNMELLQYILNFIV